jgi:hypothetical protein
VEELCEVASDVPLLLEETPRDRPPLAVWRRCERADLEERRTRRDRPAMYASANVCVTFSNARSRPYRPCAVSCCTSSPTNDADTFYNSRAINRSSERNTRAARFVDSPDDTRSQITPLSSDDSSVFAT